MKITVNRLKLIASIEAKVKELQLKYDKEKAKYDKELAEAETIYIKNVESYLDKIKKDHGKIKSGYEATESFKGGLKWPSAPAEPEKYSETLAKLRLAEDVEIEIGDKDEEYFAYLGKRRY